MSKLCDCGSKPKHPEYIRIDNERKVDFRTIYAYDSGDFIKNTPAGETTKISIIDIYNQPMTYEMRRHLSKRVDLRHPMDSILFSSFCLCGNQISKPLEGTEYLHMHSNEYYSSDNIVKNQVVIHDCTRNHKNAMKELLPLLLNHRWKRLMIIIVFALRFNRWDKKNGDDSGVGKELKAIAKANGWKYNIDNEIRYKGKSGKSNMVSLTVEFARK